MACWATATPAQGGELVGANNITTLLRPSGARSGPQDLTRNRRLGHGTDALPDQRGLGSRICTKYWEALMNQTLRYCDKHDMPIVRTSQIIAREVRP